MDLDQARAFARKNHRAVLATRARGGGVQQSPVLVTVDDDGSFLVSTREAAYKTRNLRSDPWAQLLVLTDQFFGDWIWVEGTAEILALPEAMDGLVAYYRSISGEHDDWDAYRSAMEQERRVLVRVHAHAAGPDHAG